MGEKEDQQCRLADLFAVAGAMAGAAAGYFAGGGTALFVGGVAGMLAGLILAYRVA